MNITFLGVWMVPEQGETVSFVIDLESGERILVDSGINTVSNLIRCNIEPCSITHLIISHSHGDHIAGLPMYLFYRYKYAPLIKKLKPSSLSIITTKDAWKAVKEYIDIPYANLSSDPNLVVNDIVQEGSNIKIGDRYEMNCFFSAHSPVTFGFKLVDLLDGTNMVYSGDTSISDTVFGMSEDTDCLIHDVVADSTYPMFSKVGHSLCEDVASYSEKKHVKMLVPVHRLPVYRDTIENYERELKEHYSGKIIIPSEGDVIEI